MIRPYVTIPKESHADDGWGRLTMLVGAWWTIPENASHRSGCRWTSGRGRRRAAPGGILGGFENDRQGFEAHHRKREVMLLEGLKRLESKAGNTVDGTGQIAGEMLRQVGHLGRGGHEDADEKRSPQKRHDPSAPTEMSE